MNKPLLLSLAAATILSSNLSAESMYERIQAMELQMKQMKQELKTLKSKKSAVVSEEADKDEDAEESDEAEETTDSEEEEDEDEREPLQDQIDEMQESIGELNRGTYGNHLKFGVDYRFAIDNLQYKMADGSEQGNDAFMTNRLWINMDWKATNNLSFRGQLAYNKAFGARSGWGTNMAGMETFDWITNENAYDDVVRVRSAYFLYRNDTFIGADIPWTFSIGRRPSTNGHLINLRDDDGAASPMGHTINVEFDGLSSKFGLENLTGVNGMYAKFCAGRGGTNANPKFFSVDPNTGLPVNSGAPYSSNENDIPDIDLVGLIFVPWTNGQYGIATQYYYADNLIDAKFSQTTGQFQGMESVGGMHSVTANFTVNGIGNDISYYLDDTFFFVSGAASITNPDEGKNMLGGTNSESKTGYSVWAGLQMPSVMSEYGRWGLEYNHGSQYWRSITYAEDTNIGSKIAARGDAYEAYFTEPLIDDILTLQVRYTYIDYKYAGSNGFFGNATGSAVEISDTMPQAAATVDTAQDIRFYLRYRY
jgi:Protein of unknown function (DUF3373)